MTSEKAMWGTPKYADDTTTLSGGAWDAGYPQSKLLDEVEIGHCARTTSAVDGAFEIKFVLSRLVPVRLISLFRHNFTIASKWERLLYSDAAWTTQVYNSGQTLVWPSLSIDAEYEDNNWWERTYTDQERTEAQPLVFDLLSSRVYIQSGIIRVYDDTNPDGYLQAALLDIARDSQLPVNYRYGSNYGFSARTLTQEAAGGAEYFERRTKRRIFSGEFQQVNRDDIQSTIYELQKTTDLNRPFLFIKKPENPSTWLREAAMVRHEKLDPFSEVSFGRDSAAFSYKEVL